MAAKMAYLNLNPNPISKHLQLNLKPITTITIPPIITSQQQQLETTSNDHQINRREVILRSTALPLFASIFHFSGKKPEYLGVQKNPAALALCPATNNCVSTSETSSDLSHYAPPWNYNPESGRGSKKPVSKEVAIQELLDVIKSTKPNKFTPRIIEQKDDYIHVEYESPIMGFVDDVEFWFPPGKKSIVEYRSAARLGNFDFDVNRKRIKALREELEKKGWASDSEITV